MLAPMSIIHSSTVFFKPFSLHYSWEFTSGNSLTLAINPQLPSATPTQKTLLATTTTTDSPTQLSTPLPSVALSLFAILRLTASPNNYTNHSWSQTERQHLLFLTASQCALPFPYALFQRGKRRRRKRTVGLTTGYGFIVSFIILFQFLIFLH